MARKLELWEINLLKLIVKCRDPIWANVSNTLMQLLNELPSELVVVERNAPEQGGGKARLTDEGNAVIMAMPWLGM